MNVTARRTFASCSRCVAATDRHFQNAPESVLCSMCSTLRRVTSIRVSCSATIRHHIPHTPERLRALIITSPRASNPSSRIVAHHEFQPAISPRFSMCTNARWDPALIKLRCTAIVQRSMAEERRRCTRKQSLPWDNL
eukprot:361745-Prymnesium_polylepis.1